MDFKENLAYLKYFGFKVTFWKTINKILCGDIDKSHGKIAWLVHEKNISVIEEYVKKTCNETYDKLIAGYYSNGKFNEYVSPEDDTLVNNVIWTMWWNGEDSAPPIIKKCIDSMRRHSSGHKVIVINKYNYKNYITLPDIVYQRISEGEKDTSLLNSEVLDFTHLCDILRSYFLYKYGGLWSDGSVYFSKNVTENYFKSEWITIGQDNEWYIGGGCWSCFFTGALAGSGLAKYIFDMYVEYWQKEKYIVNYLLIDYIIDIAYKNCDSFKIMISNGYYENKKCLTVNKHFKKQIIDEDNMHQFFENQGFHKLSYKYMSEESYNEKAPNTLLKFLIKNY